MKSLSFLFLALFWQRLFQILRTRWLVDSYYKIWLMINTQQIHLPHRQLGDGDWILTLLNHTCNLLWWEQEMKTLSVITLNNTLVMCFSLEERILITFSQIRIGQSFYDCFQTLNWKWLKVLDITFTTRNQKNLLTFSSPSWSGTELDQTNNFNCNTTVYFHFFFFCFSLSDVRVAINHVRKRFFRYNHMRLVHATDDRESGYRLRVIEKKDAIPWMWKHTTTNKKDYHWYRSEVWCSLRELTRLIWTTWHNLLSKTEWKIWPWREVNAPKLTK